MCISFGNVLTALEFLTRLVKEAFEPQRLRSIIDNRIHQGLYNWLNL